MTKLKSRAMVVITFIVATFIVAPFIVAPLHRFVSQKHRVPE